MKRPDVFVFTVCAVCISWVSCCSSQDWADSLQALRSSAPRVFIDCVECDMDFIRTEITFANYVRDPKEAQVYVLVTSEETSGGGTEYAVAFIGQQDYSGMDDTLKFISKQSDSEDDIRRGIVRVLKMGLVRYVAKTPLADKMSISFEEEMEPTAVVDRWNSWVFSMSARSFLNGERSRDETFIYGSLSATRITPELKTKLSVYGTYKEDNYQIGEKTVSSISKSKSLYGLMVKSLGEHWSIGAAMYVYSSSYTNVDLSLSAGPAVEYNLFPYSESTRREFRFLYKLAGVSADYAEETIFDKSHEYLTNESLSATLELKRTWGSISTSLEASHYFHDFRKNRLELDNELSLRIIEGLSFDLSGRVARIHDQLSLPKGDATAEDIYLQRIQLATHYDYWSSIGLSYTFGSIYSNVVNPRFGD